MGYAYEAQDGFTAPVRDILRIVHEMKEAAALSYESLSYSFPTTSDTSNVIDSINLPSPSPLLPSFLDAGFDPEISAEVDRIYQHCAKELRRRIQESITTTCREIAELPVVALASSSDLLVSKIVSTFSALYVRRLEQWKGDITQRIAQALRAPRNVCTFNCEYTPLLGRFFEENPFPTRADKELLAKKSNMQYRQIHVWFQNRRSRSKKEGRMLRKKPTYEGATKSFGKLYGRMRGHTITIDSGTSKPSGVSSSEVSIENNMLEDAFVSSPPPHAFPSPYPPTCPYDPFPCKGGSVRFDKPEWRRIPDGKHAIAPLTGVDDLARQFSRLSVRDGTRSEGSTKMQSRAATVAITVVPSRAPHPSLMVRKYTQPANPIQLGPPVRAPASCWTAFQSPGPNSAPVTLVPISTPLDNTPPRKRKVAPLPQRLPGRTRTTCRDTTPSDTSMSSSPCLFTTDPESRNYSFSSISSSSTLSDAASIQELPHLFGSPCRSLLDSPIHHRDLGDATSISLASVS